MCRDSFTCDVTHPHVSQLSLTWCDSLIYYMTNSCDMISADSRGVVMTSSWSRHHAQSDSYPKIIHEESGSVTVPNRVFVHRCTFAYFLCAICVSYVHLHLCIDLFMYSCLYIYICICFSRSLHIMSILRMYIYLYIYTCTYVYACICI